MSPEHVAEIEATYPDAGRSTVALIFAAVEEFFAAEGVPLTTDQSDALHRSVSLVRRSA